MVGDQELGKMRKWKKQTIKLKKIDSCFCIISSIFVVIPGLVAFLPQFQFVESYFAKRKKNVVSPPNFVWFFRMKYLQFVVVMVIKQFVLYFLNVSIILLHVNWIAAMYIAFFSVIFIFPVELARVGPFWKWMCIHFTMTCIYITFSFFYNLGSNIFGLWKFGFDSFCSFTFKTL